MTDFNREIKDCIRRLAGKMETEDRTLIFCSVTSVDEAERTCNASPISSDEEDNDIENINLMAEQNDGMYLVPKIGSTIVVSVSKKDTPFAILFSELDKVKMNADTVIELQDGSFGGLTKTEELKTQLDKLNAQLQAVISTLTNWTPAPGDGGTALKTAFAIAITGKVEGNFSNIENIKVTHGT